MRPDLATFKYLATFRTFLVLCTVGAQIPNQLGIRMVQSRAVLVLTIQNRTRVKLGRFLCKEKKMYKGLG